VFICCNKCSSHIHLTGFSLLQEMDPGEEEMKGRKKKDSVCCVSSALDDYHSKC
jgi:hypothetical protein